MQCRLFECNWVKLPAALSIATEPLERARSFCIRRSPACAECEIDVAVAVDIMRLNADVVAGGFAVNDFVFSPRRVFVPDDGVFGNDHDIGLSIAVHIGGRDCVADLAGVRVDFLGLKSREVCGNGRK